jgi:hypothetical protein
LKFFFDNCVSKHLAEIISILEGKTGHELCHLTQRFDAATPDTIWLNELSAEKGWIIISADDRLRRGSVEKVAWKRASVVSFFLSKNWVNHTKYEQAWRFVKWWPRIVEQASLAMPGAAFEVSENVTGKFKQL